MEQHHPIDALFGSLIIKKNSLWGIWANISDARERYFERIVFVYGEPPGKIIMSKNAYRLTYLYDIARGNFSSGDWLGLPVIVLWDILLDDNELAVMGAFSGEQIGWCMGGEPYVLTEEHFKEMKKREFKLKPLIQMMHTIQTRQKEEQCGVL